MDAPVPDPAASGIPVRALHQQQRDGDGPQLLFGDEPDAPIIATSPTNPGFERHWARLSEGVEEVIEARIYSGIHYRTSDEDGAAVGRKVARFVVNHALRARHQSKD